MNRSHRSLALWMCSFLLGIGIAATAAADVFVPPPPPITQADREARVATAGQKLREMPAMFDRCFERHPGVTDPVSMRFELRQDGRAYRVSVAGAASRRRSRGLEQCISTALRRFQWAPSRVERVWVTHRFTRSDRVLAVRF